MPLYLQTTSKITWCPGCPNNQILVSFRKVVSDLVAANEIKIENLVCGAGIGCHGKISDYLNTNTFTALHGRVIPALEGIKVANPNLTVVGFSGDGDSFDEGLEHLVHAARRNANIKIFLHDNRIFALTTGQATALSPKGFKGKSTPAGNPEEPFNPLSLILSAGASFVARTYAGDIAGTERVMQAAIHHQGFAFVDIIQPCITFFDSRDYFKDRIYWIDENKPKNDLNEALRQVMTVEEKVALGVFYEK
jgi:2-oxoglutarate/2-oxoacid ferredoxin oxidoreductase subunit beta